MTSAGSATPVIVCVTAPEVLPALTRTAEQMDHIRLCRERFDHPNAAGSDAVEEDIAFHNAVAEACGNRFFSMTMSALAPQTRCH